MSAQNGQQHTPPDATRDPAKARDELDVYDRVTRPAARSEEFEETNYGLGYYDSDEELYQQVQSYQAALYGRAAFEGPLRQRKLRAARQKWLRNEYRGGQFETVSFEDWCEETGGERWKNLSRAEKDRAIETHLGTSPGFIAPQQKMMEIRLETSRGRGARLLDNVFGRVQEQHYSGDMDAQEVLNGGGRR